MNLFAIDNKQIASILSFDIDITNKPKTVTFSNDQKIELTYEENCIRLKKYLGKKGTYFVDSLIEQNNKYTKYTTYNLGKPGTISIITNDEEGKLLKVKTFSTMYYADSTYEFINGKYSVIQISYDWNSEKRKNSSIYFDNNKLHISMDDENTDIEIVQDKGITIKTITTGGSNTIEAIYEY